MRSFMRGQLFSGVVLSLVWSAVASAEGPVPAAEGPATLKLTPGFTATLFAGEPLLSSPSNIDIDASGRVWVCEVVNYRGKKETRTAGDRILVLEDSDGDGVADRRTVFHQGRDVDSALGICVIGDGPGRRAIISCAPEVFILHDDDGDLVADRKEILFTKTGQQQHDHSVHAVSVGPDGRIYFNFGNTGHAVHDRDGKAIVDRCGNTVNDSGSPYRQGMVFRCRPDGSDFEVLGHNFRNNYEVAVDSFGRLWQSDNDDDGNRGVRINQVMEYGNYGYVDERTGAGWRIPRTNLEHEVPLQHWHQNDPGVVPNLLLTGAGSPTGICVYEGSLLPPRYRGSLIHCDAGPNVVRAYHVTGLGAGFEAEMEPLVDGSADRWFRPSDVCVAADGSLLVADWYDPGVGGHGMADTEKGRIYRIAPTGSRWSVPQLDLRTLAGAVAGLSSPNLSTRATALERISREPDAAEPLLREALARATAAGDDRLAARLSWAVGMLPGRADAMIAALATDARAEFRNVAVRMCRLVEGDVVGLAERLADDPAAEVRREAAIALHGLAGPRADRAWARLALRHAVGDRWETEALGIGADGHWEGRLAAWRASVGDAWSEPAGREIVWRSRAPETSALLCELLSQPATTTAESLALLRALDFQPTGSMEAAVVAMLPSYGGSSERLSVVLPELVLRAPAAAAGVPDVARRGVEAAEMVRGTQRFVEIVSRFGIREQVGSLMDLAAATSTDPELAAAAVKAAYELGGHAAVRDRLAQVCRAADPMDSSAAGLLTAVGRLQDKAAVAAVEACLHEASYADAVRIHAARGLGGSHAGCRRLLELAAQDQLSPAMRQAAAVALSTAPWAEIRQQAAASLPLPKAAGGKALPAVAELIKKRGNVAAGKEVFAGVGTCAKCHVVGAAGKAVGPDLSGIGSKLSREAIYESILAPSAAISHNYETFTAVCGDGRAVTGLLLSKTPQQVVIRQADGSDAMLAQADIEELIRQPVSLMPADLATMLSAEQLIDLVAWLETLRQSQ